jgi:hypothetical protein
VGSRYHGYERFCFVNGNKIVDRLSNASLSKRFVLGRISGSCQVEFQRSFQTRLKSLFLFFFQKKKQV